LPPTVSASPPGGTYNSTQTVTLAASRTPSTIFYTTDGTTPTTSSANGTSPASLTISTNSTLKFFAKDSLGNVGPIGLAQYTIILPVLIPMNDTTASFGLKTYSAVPIQAEYVTPTSFLLGKSIDTIVVDLKKTGLPSGPVQVGVFNSDASVKQLFGNIDASAIGSTGYAQYSFSLPVSHTYKIQSGDRIGIKFTGGDTSNLVGIMTDQNNMFDGINSYLNSYIKAWNSYTGKDLTMTLRLHI
jgi:hypothetical protein